MSSVGTVIYYKNNLFYCCKNCNFHDVLVAVVFDVVNLYLGSLDRVLSNN